MSLVFGTFEVAILLVMKIAEREEGDPGPLVMTNPMNKQEGRSNLSMYLTRDRIHHASRVDDRMTPEGARHLFFGKIGTSHMHHDLPMGFNQTI